MKKQKNNPKLLDIRLVGDKVLRLQAEKIETFDDEFLAFCDDLIHTMYITDGVGLAAPQVGVSKQVFAIDYEWGGEDSAKKNPLIYVNPEITFSEGSITHEEGCLSVPDVFEKVKRPNHIKIKAQDRYGNPIEEELTDFPAVVFQHEFDHLKGVLFIDHLTKLKLLLHKPKINSIKNKTNDNGENIQKSKY